MSKPIRYCALLLILAAGVVGTACQQKSGSQQSNTAESGAPPQADVVATVDNRPITATEFRAYLRHRAGGREPQLSDSDRQTLLNQLVSIELLAQQARQEGLTKDPDIQADLEIQRASLLANRIVRRFLEKNPVTDQELKAAYEDHLKGMDQTEYKARHILVKSEDEAKALIAKLDKGADFGKLAEKNSIGPSSKNGGELGWFSPSAMVEPFASAVKQLKKGQYTHTPVHTQFGWHVIQLEDTRAVPPPSFDDLKDQLQNELQSQKIEAYVNQLRGQAKVDIKPTAPATPPATGNGPQQPPAAPPPQT